MKKLLSILLTPILTLGSPAYSANDTKRDLPINCEYQIIGEEPATHLPSTTLSAREALLTRVADKDIVRELIAVHLLYSIFFTTVATHAKVDPKSLALLTAEELEATAAKIYEEMALVFGRKSSIPNPLKSIPNVELTHVTFLKYSKQTVIDKIGESLFIIGQKGEFIEMSGIEMHQSVTGLGAAAAILSGFTLFFGVMDWATTFVEPVFWTTMVKGATLSLASSIAWLTQEKKVARWLTGKKLQRQHLGIIHDPSRLERVVSRALPQLKAGELKKKINAIVSQAGELEPSQRITPNGSLITFGSQSLELHAELVNIFIRDFMLWMKIYELHRDTIKEKLIAIQNGKTPGQRDETLRFLSQVFLEATEATSLATVASDKVVGLLEASRNALREYGETNSLNRTQQTDLDRRIEILAISIQAHMGFQLGLIAIHETVSQTMLNLDRMKGAETARMIEAMSSQMGGLVTEQLAVGQILDSLNSLDAQLQTIERGIAK